MPAGSFPAFVAEYPGNCERWYPRVQQSLGATASQVMGTGVFDPPARPWIPFVHDHSRGLANPGEDAFYPIYREPFGFRDRVSAKIAIDFH